MLRKALIVIALSVSAIAEAKLPSPPPDVAPQVVNEDRYPAHNVTFRNGVRGIPGAIYWEPVGYRPLTLNLYLPPSSVERPATGCPVIKPNGTKISPSIPAQRVRLRLQVAS